MLANENKTIENIKTQNDSNTQRNEPVFTKSTKKILNLRINAIDRIWKGK